MKRYNILILFSVFSVISCKKTNVSNSTSSTSVNLSVAGKWNLVSFTNHLSTGQFKNSLESNFSYKGIATDYYDFNADGILYIKKGKMVRTMNYTILNNGSIQLSYKDQMPDTVKISSLSSNKAVLITAKNYELGQVETFVANLSR